MLDKNSPIPLYYQLVEAIRDRIGAGDLKPGEQLAGERELGEHYGISRMTVRQALQFLVREEALTTRQGLGTFVAEPKLTYDALHVLGFSEDMLRRGAAASSRVIEQTRLVPPPSVARQLALPPADRVVKIVRLRLSDGVPMLLETVFVPAQRFAGLEWMDLSNQSLYRLMQEHYGVRLGGSKHTLEAVQANDYECDLFGIVIGQPMILLQGVTFDVDDRPVESFKAVYRGDRFQMAFDSRRGERDAINASLMSVVIRNRTP
jgi:GntR family transcriptional regulator